jgi:pilus assembly protein Flp/PilA
LKQQEPSIMRDNMRTFLADESGATAIEYGLIASLISIVAIAAFKMVGTHLTTTFSKVAGNLQ